MKPALLVICTITDIMRARLRETFDVTHVDDLDDTPAWLAENGDRIAYVLTDGHWGLRPELMDRMPNLRAISCFGVGYDAIDTDLTNARGIPVSHTPDVLNAEVATTAMMLYLACYRNFEAELAQARTGRWENGSLPLARTADGRTVGILGLGRIGKAVAKKLEAFGATIAYSGRNPQDVPYRYYADLVEMARDVEALVCVAPGGAATRQLVNAEVMDALGPDGVLVNVGRGSVVDEAALIGALEGNRLGWAGLDVFEDEPRIPPALRNHPRTILTPHIGAATIETRTAMGDLAIDNLLTHLKDGKVLTPVPESRHLS